MTDQAQYAKWQEEQFKKWESLCRRCGACCGATDGDPCEHLRSSPAGQYFCNVYENRFGEHRTRSGKVFRCVPIRDILHQPWPGDACCGYKNPAEVSLPEGPSAPSFLL